MSRLFKWHTLMSLAVIFFLIWVSWAEKKGHVFKEEECFKCHLSLGGGKKVFVKDIDTLCDECHSDMGLSHPSGKKPSMSLPAVFPLDWRGRMTCATCHDIHITDSKSDFLLRGGYKAGRVFCYLCHKDTIGQHSGSDQPAHTANRFEIINESHLIDDLSTECLCCHDSSVAKGTNIGMGAWTHRTGTEHPVGVDYMKAFKNGGYRHPSELNKVIRLFGGRVGCGSCHNMYSKEKLKLAMSNKGSALCLACHLK